MNPRHAIAETTLGPLTLVACGDAVTGVYFPGHWYLPPKEAIGDLVDLESDALLSEVAAQLTDYLAGARTSFDLPTSTRGNPLQERVWEMLREIPFGATTTYGALAERLGDKALSQAVGQAVGHNPLSIIVPCHRVVGSTGKLTGFAGGLARKRALLDLEEPIPVKAGRLF